jgi:uncharacterized protein (DUF342 family)
MASDALFKEGVLFYGEKFTLKVSKDRLEALIVPRAQGSAVNLAEIDMKTFCDELRAAGVDYGLLPKPMAESDGSYCVAQGVEVVNGENAKIKTYVKPGIAQIPKANDPMTDKIDFHEMGAIVNVPKDKLLLEKVPLTIGQPGRLVTGEVVNPKPGKDVVIRAGQGITLSDDGSKGISAVEGKFVLVDGKAAVLVEHTVNGDIDFNVGNIAFVGTRLTITGAIQPGFKVKCKGDVVIGQSVQYSAEVTAGGNLEIKAGVIGHEIAIKCWGNFAVNFMENVGRVEVKGDLNVTESMVQVHALVGGNIRVMKGKGVLAGGKYIVGGSVFVKELGSTDEVETDLSVGVNPALDEKKDTLNEEQAVCSAKMNELIRNTTGLKTLQKEKGNDFPPEQLLLLTKYNHLLPLVMEQVNKLAEEEEALNAEIEQAVSESIYVFGDLHPGAKISIGGITRILTSTEKGVIIYFDREKRQIHCRGMSPEERQQAGS